MSHRHHHHHQRYCHYNITVRGVLFYFEFDVFRRCRRSPPCGTCTFGCGPAGEWYDVLCVWVCVCVCVCVKLLQLLYLSMYIRGTKWAWESDENCVRMCAYVCVCVYICAHIYSFSISVLYTISMKACLCFFISTLLVARFFGSHSLTIGIDILLLFLLYLYINILKWYFLPFQ